MKLSAESKTVSFMSLQSVLSALLQNVVPPLFPFISIISHLSPSFSLTFLFASSSLSPSLLAAPLSHLHLLLSTYVSLPWSRGPDLVVVGFQMVWLAEGSELTPLQLILSYLKPQGVREGTRISGKMRGRGQERDRGLVENCVTAEPVIYCISSSNSLRLFLSKCLHFRVV